jgi:REP-associated tyrosine transposase
MGYNPKFHHRKSIRLKEYDYSNPNWYYVTICTNHHKNLFGKVISNRMILNDYGKIVTEEWLKTKQIRENVDLDYYVVMPNHIHGIIIIECRDTARCVPTDINRKFGEMIPGSLPAIIRSFKSAATKRINEIRKEPGLSVWQKNYYEHIIRNENDLFNIRKYIELNPFKWFLDEYYR